MKKRQSWRKIGIGRLSEQYGMTEDQAARLFENTYRKLLHRMRKLGSKELNIQRETYYSMFSKSSSTQLATIQTGMTTSFVEVNDILTTAEDVDKAFISARLSKLGETYDEVAEMIKAYKSDVLTYDELTKQIKTFKETNKKYLNRTEYAKAE